MTASTPRTAAADRQTPLTRADIVLCTLQDFLLYFLRLGTFGFGGPIALAGYLQGDLVERRRWITKQDYVEGLALAQLAPGRPLSWASARLPTSRPLSSPLLPSGCSVHRKVPEPLVILAAGVVGLLLQWAAHT